MKSTLLAQVLAQKLTGLGIDEAKLQLMPLNVNTTADPPGRSALVSGFDFNAAIQMNRALAVLVAAERLKRKRNQRRFLFGEHHRYLPLGRAVNTRVRPVDLPPIEVVLRLFKSFKSESLQRRSLGVAYS